MNSEQYNRRKNKFQNPHNTPISTGRSWVVIMYDFIFKTKGRTPKEKLPVAPLKLSELKIINKNLRFAWLGHSTVLLEIDSNRILIDPVFSTYASPVPFMVKRFQPPVLTIDEIHNIDIILISHDHYDHLDYKTITKLKARDIQYVVPLGVGSHLESWGVDNKKITELTWWNSTNHKGLKLTCTPAQHFSGRGFFNRNKTLWSSWSIQGQNENIFYSGDSGYGKHYKEIGNRLGPFDLTFLENGAYSLDWKFVHQLPEEAVQAHIDLKGEAMIPVHWGMFNLGLHTWFDPIIRITDEAEKRGVRIIVPKLGQLISMDKNYVLEDWWSEIISRETN
ncbi:MAG: MBL fold metallo-hydrolase [Spirochaetota bacterium]|nr:MBL fold metallo-hydrolase [Spirochaetota bacterium]